MDFKVRASDADNIIEFCISREEFKKRYHLSQHIGAEFYNRWVQVQEACRIAYMFAEPIQFRHGRAALNVPLAHFLSDYRG